MMKTLKKGAQGAAVAAVQRNLKDLGLPVKVDGDFGPKTEAAVARVKQKRKRRLGRKKADPVESVVDAVTAEVLREAAETRRVAKRSGKFVLSLGSLGAMAGVYAALNDLAQHAEGQEARLMSGSVVQVGIALTIIAVPLAAVAINLWQSGVFGNRG
ncbi:MAG: putative peptidoglycan-binding domain-containing protein [Kiloniellales bacterium]